MKEFYNSKSEEIPSIIDDITSDNCEIKFVSKRRKMTRYIMATDLKLLN